jgi:SAM-dependent methyltransferase
MKKEKDSGWQEVSDWYQECVGQKGHYYHQHLILPTLKKHLDTDHLTSVLDLGCGQGVFERVLPAECFYTGVDASSRLLDMAKKQQKKGASRDWVLHDLNEPLNLGHKYDLALFLLSLQNIQDPQTALASAKAHLKDKGKLAIVMNHPCFRIPRQSDWLELPSRGIARLVHHYMGSLQIPIKAHPSQGDSTQSISYHHNLTDLFRFLENAGLKVCHLEEWNCCKVSEGGKARLENRARAQIPLFLYLVATA